MAHVRMPAGGPNDARDELATHLDLWLGLSLKPRKNPESAGKGQDPSDSCSQHHALPVEPARILPTTGMLANDCLLYSSLHPQTERSQGSNNGGRHCSIYIYILENTLHSIPQRFEQPCLRHPQTKVPLLRRFHGSSHPLENNKTQLSRERWQAMVEVTAFFCSLMDIPHQASNSITWGSARV